MSATGTPNDSNQVPARLRVLLAARSPQALILRRGPSRQVLTIGWNRSSDTFTPGQWLKGVIYDADLSPDGSHWIYGASRREAWTAVARTPWLKAVDYYQHGGGYTWGGGGLFLSDREYWLFTGPHPFTVTRKQSGYAVTEGHDTQGDGIVRWTRDRWKPRRGPLAEDERRQGFYKKISGDWRLHVRFRVQLRAAQIQGKGYCYNHYSLGNQGTGETVDTDWDWADVDGEHLLWAEKGKLYRGGIDELGAVSGKLLFDANQFTFTERAAPYE